MRIIRTIAWKTIQSAIRSRAVHLLVVFLALTCVLLPLMIAFDGTAKGLVQVTLTYTLGLTMVLLSLTTVWLGCTVITDDIEGHQIHLVTTKSVSRLQFWLGKWTAIVGLNFVLLLVSSSMVLMLLNFRLGQQNFDDLEMEELHNEVMVGRRVYHPEPLPIEEMVQEEFQRRLQAHGIPAGMTEEMVLSSLRRDVKTKLQEVPPGAMRPWSFNGLPTQLGEEDQLFFRYRMYVDSKTNRDQRETFGGWVFVDQRSGTAIQMPTQTLGGVFHERTLPPVLPSEDGQQAFHLIGETGQLHMGYTNQDPGMKSVVFQSQDGPTVMLRVTGFASNYFRAILLLFLELVFLATLSCLCGSLMSTPVAVFLSYSYIFVGALVRSMEPAKPEDAMGSSGAVDSVLTGIREIVGFVLVSVNDFNKVTELARGELIEPSIAATGGIVHFAARALILLLLVVIGLWLFERRELGLVVRR